MIDLIEKEIIKKEMDALCGKVGTFCWGNATCEGCPLNNGHDDNKSIHHNKRRDTKGGLK